MPKSSQSNYSVYSRVFTSGVMRDLAKHRRSSLLGRLLTELPVGAAGSLRDFFNQAYSSLSKAPERNEYIYKNVLTHKVFLGTHSLKTATVVPELRVGAVKADFTIFNGTSSVYEIKTDRDTLKRLQNQIDHYRLFFDKIHVVSGESHVDTLLAELPSIVGLVVVNSRMQRTTIREAESNWVNIDPRLVFESLRVAEINEILTMHGMNIPAVPNTLLRKAQFELFSKLDIEQIHKATVCVIRKYRGKQTLERFLDSLPSSLKAVGVSIDFTVRERTNFLDSLNVNIAEALTWA